MIYAIIAVVALLAGGGIGFAIFRYVVTGKYKRIMEQADKDANVLKQKKLLEVKEKYLNQKSKLEEEAQQRNQRIQQNENRRMSISSRSTSTMTVRCSNRNRPNF